METTSKMILSPEYILVGSYWSLKHFYLFKKTLKSQNIFCLSACFEGQTSGGAGTMVDSRRLFKIMRVILISMHIVCILILLKHTLI